MGRIILGNLEWSGVEWSRDGWVGFGPQFGLTRTTNGRFVRPQVRTRRVDPQPQDI